VDGEIGGTREPPIAFQMGCSGSAGEYKAWERTRSGNARPTWRMATSGPLPTGVARRVVAGAFILVASMEIAGGDAQTQEEDPRWALGVE